MSVNIVALVFVLSGLFLALFLIKPTYEFYGRGFVIWAIAACLLFGMSGEPATVLGGTMIAMLVAAPVKPSARVALFLVVAPCLPGTLSGVISLPGITTLFDATHYKLAVIALLVPSLFGENAAGQKFTLAEGALIAYAASTALIVSTAESATIALRFLVDQLLIIVVPYMAIRRSIRTSKDLELIMNAFVMASIILASEAMVATFKQWDFYRLFEPYAPTNFADFRGGFLRIFATATQHSLGFHLVAAILMLEALRTRAPSPFRRALFLQPLFLAALYFTHSRGAFGALALGIAVMIYIRIQNAAVRGIFLTVVAIGGAAAGYNLLYGNVEALDEYGTLQYRRDLLETSIAHILAHPFFGDTTFWTRPEFQHLVQGQGMIDMTNLYLLIFLLYGFPIGLLFFVPVVVPLLKVLLQGTRGRSRYPTSTSDIGAYGPTWDVAWPGSPALLTARIAGPQGIRTQKPEHALSFRTAPLNRPETAFASPSAASAPDQPDADAKDAQYRLIERAVAGGCIAGWLFLVVTTSDVGLTIHLGMLVAAIGAVVSARDFK